MPALPAAAGQDGAGGPRAGPQRLRVHRRACGSADHAGAAGGACRHQPVSLPADVHAHRRHLAARVPGRAARPPFPGELRNGTALSRRGLRRRLRLDQPRLRAQPDRPRHDARRATSGGGRGETITLRAGRFRAGTSAGCGATSKGICSVMLGDKDDQPRSRAPRGISERLAHARRIGLHGVGRAASSPTWTAGGRTSICRWTSRAPRSSGRSGATCSRSPTAKRAPTARLPAPSARPSPFAPWRAPARPTRLPRHPVPPRGRQGRRASRLPVGRRSGRRRCSRKRLMLMCDLAICNL